MNTSAIRIRSDITLTVTFEVFSKSNRPLVECFFVFKLQILQVGEILNCSALMQQLIYYMKITNSRAVICTAAHR